MGIINPIESPSINPIKNPSTNPIKNPSTNPIECPTIPNKTIELNKEIDKLKNELEQTKNKLNIQEQNNLWVHILKEGNPLDNFNNIQNNNNLSQEQKKDYKKIN